MNLFIAFVLFTIFLFDFFYTVFTFSNSDKDYSILDPEIYDNIRISIFRGSDC